MVNKKSRLEQKEQKRLFGFFGIEKQV